MVFQHRHPNVVTPDSINSLSKKNLGVIGPKSSGTPRSTSTVNKENMPPPTPLRSSLDDEIQGLNNTMAASFKIYDDKENESEEASSIESMIKESPPPQPHVAQPLMLLKPTQYESLPPASPGNLDQYRYDKNWWKNQKQGLKSKSPEVTLEVLRSGTPMRRTLSNFQSRVANNRGFSSPSPIKPPPGLDYVGAVRRGTRETPMRLPKVQSKVPLPTRVEAPPTRRQPTIMEQAVQACRGARTTKSPRDAERAEELLRKAVSDFHMQKTKEPVDGSMYNNLIHAYAERHMPEKTETIVHLMWHDYKNGNVHAQPNVRVYTSVLYAWEKSKKPDAAEHCEKILESMQRICDSGAADGCKPDLFAYTCCLHTWADAKTPDAPERAMALFRKMKQRCLEGNSSLRPDAVCYINLMNAYANSPKWRETEEILFEMVDDYLSGSTKAKPPIRAFNTVLALWSKSNDSKAPDRAEAILRRLHELNSTGQLDVKADEFSYSLILKAWASSSHRDAPKEAEQALYWMEDLYQQGGNDGARLDVIKYSTVISALSRAGHPGNAEHILRKMLEDYEHGNTNAKPDVKCFHAVLTSWSHYRNAEVSAARAQNIIGLMWTLTDEGIVPDSRAYNSVLFCWKSAKAPLQAEACLREMERFGVSPNRASFDSVIETWKRSNWDQADSRIQDLEVERYQRFGGRNTLNNAPRRQGRSDNTGFRPDFEETRSDKSKGGGNIWSPVPNKANHYRGAHSKW